VRFAGHLALMGRQDIHIKWYSENLKGIDYLGHLGVETIER
jgi:hypothetical protein